MTFQLKHIETTISYEDFPASHASWHQRLLLHEAPTERPIFQQTRLKKTLGYAVEEHETYINIWCTKITGNQRTPCMAPKINWMVFLHFPSKNMVVWRRSGLTGHSQKSMYRRMPKNPITSPIYQSMSENLPNTPNHIQQYPYPQIYPIISCNIPTLSPLYLKTSRFYLQNILFRRLVTWIISCYSPIFHRISYFSHRESSHFAAPPWLPRGIEPLQLALFEIAEAQALCHRLEMFQAQILGAPEALMWRMGALKGSLGKFASTLESTWW